MDPAFIIAILSVAAACLCLATARATANVSTRRFLIGKGVMWIICAVGSFACALQDSASEATVGITPAADSSANPSANSSAESMPQQQLRKLDTDAHSG